MVASTVPTVGPAALSSPPTRRSAIFTLAEMRWAALAVVLFAGGLTVQLTHGPVWLCWAMFSACYGAGGWGPALAGLRALRERTLDVDLLMVVAAIGAAAIGQITEGALLIVIFATSGALEALATTRTEDSVRGLLELAPETGVRVDAAGDEQTVAATDLDIGDVLVVRPGARIAADATVIGGRSEVDQATVTGESLPVDKAPGSRVYAGTLNGTGALRVRVQRRAADSVVARIASLVEQAGRTKARAQLFIEKIEQRYSIGMVALTLAVFAVPLLVGEPLSRSLLRAMTFMIVASPCAVVLATMPPLLAAIANAGRHGVLVKSAVVMERLGTTTRVAFDKTGTLTRGVPELTEIRWTDPQFTDEQVLRAAGAAERPSEHPLAAAIVRAARARGVALPTVTEFGAHPGRGVTARVEGSRVAVHSPEASKGLCGDTGTRRDDPQHGDGTGADSRVTGAVAALRAEGATAVVVTRDDRPMAVLGIGDRPRPEAAAAVAATERLTGAPAILLTGDHRATADRLATDLGLTDVRAEQLPDDKVAVVRQLHDAGERVSVVGDGINDAPAFAAAHTGIAMGTAGSDLTLQTADAIVVRDDLTAVAAVIELSRRARRVVTANLVIAATFLGALVVWDLVGTLPLPLGVAGHEGSTILVGLNGLRVLRRAAWPAAR